MGRLIGIIIVLGAVWSGWWYIAAAGAERAVSSWFDARAAEGWQAEKQSLRRSGYPTQLNLRIDAPQLADPETGVALSADHLTLSAPAWWPGDVTLTLPETPLRLASPEGALDLIAADAEALMHLHPGPSLQLERMQATSGPWQITSTAGAILTGTDFDLSMQQDETRAETYSLAITVADLAPGAALREGLPPDWPLTFDTYQARMTVTFDTPWDRRALQDRRPQPRKITIDGVDITWGPLRHVASGSLDIDAQGIPEGQLDLRLENWRQALDVAQKSGALAGDVRPQAETILGILANLGGDPDTLNLPLSFNGGRMAVGPIPLGPAPRITLR